MTSEMINESEYNLERKSCSLLMFTPCDNSYALHSNWSITNTTNNEAKLTIRGLVPYSNHSFNFSGSQNVVFQARTSAAAPKGFVSGKISTTYTLTSLTVTWDHPDMPNGPLENVMITATPESSKKRSTKMMLISSDYAGTVTFNNLSIGTDYIINVQIMNRLVNTGSL